MDIYQFAMQMEKDGENYYRELASASRMAGLKRIFSMLADEEVKHFHFIDELRRKQGQASLAETSILTDVKNIFIDMKEGKPDLHIDTTADTDAFRKARDIEEKSMVFYREKADEATEESVKDLLLRIAREEEKHMHIMQNLVEFVSKPEPGNWLENAEWHHMEEY